MVREKTKAVALIYSLILTAVYFASFSVDSVGLTADCSFVRLFTYQNFHANFFHLLCNLWVLLTFAFCVHTPLYKLIIAYVFSGLCGLLPLTEGQVIVGLSGMLYVLTGMYAFYPQGVRAKLRYQAYVLLTFLIALLLPNVAVNIHIYCYIAGLLLALLLTPTKLLHDKGIQKA